MLRRGSATRNPGGVGRTVVLGTDGAESKVSGFLIAPLKFCSLRSQNLSGLSGMTKKRGNVIPGKPGAIAISPSVIPGKPGAIAEGATRNPGFKY